MTDPITVISRFDPDSFREAMMTLTDAPKPTGANTIGKGLLFGAVFGALVMIFVRLGLGFNPDPSHFLSAVLGAFVVLGLWWGSARRLQKTILAHVSKAAKLNDPQTMTFSATGLTIKSAIAQSTMEWAAVMGIVQGKHATIINIGGNSLSVPHRDLPDGLHEAEFATQLETWKSL